MRVTCVFYDGFQVTEIDNNRKDLRVLLYDFSKCDLEDLVYIYFYQREGVVEIPIPLWFHYNVQFLTQGQCIDRYVCYCNFVRKTGVWFGTQYTQNTRCGSHVCVTNENNRALYQITRMKKWIQRH